MSRSLHALLPAMLMTLLGHVASGQFSDDFSDGDITSGTVWSGDDALFTVADDNGDLRLRSNSPGAATYYLSTPSTQSLDAQWEFFLDLRFSTSGANYVDVYLMSPQADLSPRPEGYFVRIGDTPDHIVLYKRAGSSNTSLIASDAGVVGGGSSNPFRIRVTRDEGHNWTLSFQPGGAGPFTVAGTAIDDTFGACTHFGFLIVQSTAAGPINNHFFDDVQVGPIPIDDIAPSLVGVNAINALEVDVQFDEVVEPASAGNVSNYGIVPFTEVASAVRDAVDHTRVRLTLAQPLLNGNSYSLSVNGVEDLAGNAVDNATTDFLYLIPDVPDFRDVVINELMVDPNPPVGLPDAEYIELFNATSDKYFDLGGWRVTTSSTAADLPDHVLVPGGYVVLVNAGNHPLFDLVPNSVPFGLSTTALVNGGTTVTLEGPGNVPVDVVDYTTGWYQDADKDDGGWSLEQINPFAPCSDQRNWRASQALQGGTPGEPNSVTDTTPDTDPPALLQVLTLDDTLIELVFSEGMNGASVANALYTISPALAIAQITGMPPSNQRVRLALGSAMEPGVVYAVSVQGITDCPGNPIGVSNTAPFALPEPPAPFDVVINEVLHDPNTTGGEYVELYNRSAKVLSMEGWQMANEDDGAVADSRTITTDPLLLFPGDHLLLTRDPAVTAAQFPEGRSERFLLVDLPSYTNAAGTVVVLDAQDVVIDLFRYDEDMHFPLLQDVKGVSLERQDPNRPTDDRTNWHSASAEVGFGTPGYANSQYAPSPSPTGTMTIDPAIFSPDNDGSQDALTIVYRFYQPGFVGTLRIYDVVGREVRRLLDNQLLGTSGAVSWDGVQDDGGKARMGPYIVHLEVFDLEGHVEHFKKTVTLAHRLDRP